MNPQPERNPGLQLPQPSLERGIGSVPPSERTGGREIGHELGGVTPMVPATPQPALPSGQAAVAAPPALMSAQDDTSSSSTSKDDDDSLDEEWTNRAKAIVEMTRDDPYLQSSEIGKVKAEFLKVRYNKDIKVAPS